MESRRPAFCHGSFPPHLELAGNYLRVGFKVEVDAGEEQRLSCGATYRPAFSRSNQSASGFTLKPRFTPVINVLSLPPVTS